MSVEAGSMPRENKVSFVLVLMISYLLISVGRIQEVFAFLTPLNVGNLVGIPCALVIIQRIYSRHPSFRMADSRSIKMIIFLYAVACISSVFSVSLRGSAQFTLLYFPKVIILFFMIVIAVDTMEDIRRLLWGYVMMVLILSLPTVIIGGAGRLAAMDITYDPNDIALLYVVSLPIVFYFACEHSGYRKFFLFFTLLVLVYAIVLSGSRGGFLGLTVVILWMLHKSRRRNIFYKAALLLLFGTVFLVFAPERYKERIETLFSEQVDYNITDKYGRLEIWKRSAKLIVKNPVLGTGPGTFGIASGFEYAKEVGGAVWRKTAHNSFILVGVEMGLIGGCIFTLLFITALREMGAIQRESKGNPSMAKYVWLSKGVQASVLGFMVCGFFLSQAYSSIAYFLVALSAAYRKVVSGSMTARESG